MDLTRSVFINCPFDQAYEPLFEAIIFAVISCNFMPRCAKDNVNSDSRLDRITNTLFSSKYSIHDLSRCQGEGDEQLARFNMPLELGMAMAFRHLTREKPEAHNWLVLIPQGHPHVKYVSDLAGFDLCQYDSTPAMIVRRVMAWLLMHDQNPNRVNPLAVLSALPAFQTEMTLLKSAWGVEPPWIDIIETAKGAIPKP